MITCDWCGKIEESPKYIQHPDFHRIRVCYDCLVEIYNTYFPPMRFRSESVMRDNLCHLVFERPHKIYTGYLKA